MADHHISSVIVDATRMRDMHAALMIYGTDQDIDLWFAACELYMERYHPLENADGAQWDNRRK